MKHIKYKQNDIQISYGEKENHKDYFKRDFLYNKKLSTEITDNHVYIREYFANYSNRTYLKCKYCLIKFTVDEDDYLIEDFDIMDYPCTFSRNEKLIKDIIE